MLCATVANVADNAAAFTFVIAGEYPWDEEKRQ